MPSQKAGRGHKKEEVFHGTSLIIVYSMTHKNYFIFKANSYYKLGLLIGKKFSEEAQKSITIGKVNKWKERYGVAKNILDITQKYFPQYIDELKGYARGANVDFLDLWTISLESDTEPDKDEAKCTSIITNNGTLIGHNEDAAEPLLENPICVVKKILRNLTMLEIYYYNTSGGNSVGVNSFGYAHTVDTLLSTDTKFGLPKNIIARYLFETKNPDEAIKKVLSLPRASGYNHNIVHKDKKIWNLELIPDEGILTHPTLPFVHTNHCLNIKTNATDKYGTASRLKFAQDQTKQNMTVDELMKLQDDTSRGQDKSLFNERTIGKMIIDFNSRVARIWLLREKELDWVEYPLDFII